MGKYFPFFFVNLHTFSFFPPTDEGDKLLVLKVYSQNELSVVDLTDESKSCLPIDPGPVGSAVAHVDGHGTFVGGPLMICGDDPDECFVYDDGEGVWSDGPPKELDRYFPYGLDMHVDGLDLHWLSGGQRNPTETFDGESFAESVSLPANVLQHCAVDLGSGRAMVVTGQGMGDAAFVVDLASGEMEELPPIPLEHQGRDLYLAACGMATRSDGSRVAVVAGGEYLIWPYTPVTTTHLFDPDLGLWTPGPPLPEPRSWGRAVQYGDSFLLVGGTSTGSLELVPYVGSILRYDADADAWEELPQALEEPDLVGVALVAPQEFAVQCQ